MAKSTRSVILVSTNDRTVDRPRNEGIANAQIYPGEILTGPVSALDPNTGDDDTDLVLRVAVESDYAQGNDPCEVAYAAGDRVFYIIPQPGDLVRLRAVAGQAVAIGDLIATGGGTTPGRCDVPGAVVAGSVLAEAESATPAAGGFFDARIK